MSQSEAEHTHTQPSNNKQNNINQKLSQNVVDENVTGHIEWTRTANTNTNINTCVCVCVNGTWSILWQRESTGTLFIYPYIYMDEYFLIS